MTFSANIDLEGNVVIKDNYGRKRAAGKYENENLRLGYGFSRALIKDPAKVTSEPGSIGIGSNTPYPLDKRLSAKSGEYDESIFFSDQADYVVKWDKDKLLKLREASGFMSEQVELSEPIELTEPIEPAEPTEISGTPEATESKYDFEVKCDCGAEITIEELKAMLEEAKQAAIENGEEDYIVYVLEDGTTKMGNLEDRLSDIIIIKCPDCGEEIEINLTDYPEFQLIDNSDLQMTDYSDLQLEEKNNK